MTTENQIIELSVSDKLLAQFKTDYAEETLPDVGTREGYKFIQEGISLVRSHRTGTEKLRQQMVKPLNDRVKEINSICKDMEEELKWIEGPMKRIKEEEDQRLQAIKDAEEEANRQRIHAITAKLEAIRNEPIEAMEMTSEQIQLRIEALETMDTDEGFDEYSETASDFAGNALEKLRNLFEKTLASEKQAIENAERETARLAEVEAQRLKDVETERLRKQAIADQEAENKRKADELAEKERVLNERMAALEVPELVVGTDAILEELEKIENLPPADDTEEMTVGYNDTFIEATKEACAEIYNFVSENPIDMIKATENIVEAIQNGSIPHIHWEIK